MKSKVLSGQKYFKKSENKTCANTHKRLFSFQIKKPPPKGGQPKEKNMTKQNNASATAKAARIVPSKKGTGGFLIRKYNPKTGGWFTANWYYTLPEAQAKLSTLEAA
jgi:hypothetical protein